MKRVLNIAGKIITALILLFTVFVMVFTIISVNTVNKDEADFFGYKPYIVLSDSMKQIFESGDMVVSKTTDTSDLKAGDIITFRSIDPANYGEVVTHKIREVTAYEGEKAYVTYGVNTGVDDAYPVPEDNVIGRYAFNLPKMGYFFQFLKSPAGYFTVILIPFLILIIVQGVKFFRLVKQYKREQQEELDAQKAEIEAERIKTQQMLKELERLKSQMTDTSGETKPHNGADISNAGEADGSTTAGGGE